jgi:hypothetical protein
VTDLSALDQLEAGVDQAVADALDQAAELAAGVARKAAGGGPVARSIQVKRVGRFGRELVADDPAAAFIENGRGAAVAHGRAMYFVVNGRDVFAQRVGPAKARPFMAPAAEVLEARAGELLAEALR